MDGWGGLKGLSANLLFNTQLSLCNFSSGVHWMFASLEWLLRNHFICSPQRHLFSGLIRAGAKLKELDLSHNALGPVGVEGMVDFMSSPVCYSLEVRKVKKEHF